MSDNFGFDDESLQLRVVAGAREESEYDIFVVAWMAWHGTEPSPQRVDADFGAYLRGEAVPHYVRHFVRRWFEANPTFLQRHAEGNRAAERGRILALALSALAAIIAVLVGWWV